MNTGIVKLGGTIWVNEKVSLLCNGLSYEFVDVTYD